MTRPTHGPRVEVVIDAVVLHGVSRAEVAGLVSSLEHTLSALAIADAPRTGALQTRAVGTVCPRAPRRAPTSPAALGAHTATAIWTAVRGAS